MRGYRCLLAVWVAAIPLSFAPACEESTVHKPATDEPPTIEITLHCIVPDQCGASIGDNPFTVRSRERQALRGVAGVTLNEGSEFCEIYLTLRNTTDTTYILSQWSLAGAFTSTAFLDDQERLWRLGYTFLTASIDGFDYTLPILANSERTMVFSIGSSRLYSGGNVSNGLVHDFDGAFKYGFGDACMVHALPVQDGKLAEVRQMVRIKGEGRVPVLIDGPRP